MDEVERLMKEFVDRAKNWQEARRRMVEASKRMRMSEELMEEMDRDFQTPLWLLKASYGLIVEDLLMHDVKERETQRQEEEAKQVLMHTVKALVAMGTQAVEPLCQALDHEDIGVRSQAAIVLGDIGDTRAVESLCRVLRDENAIVRIQVAEALGNIGR